MTNARLLNEETQRFKKKFTVEINIERHNFNSEELTRQDIEELIMKLRNIENDRGYEYGFLNDIANIIENK